LAALGSAFLTAFGGAFLAGFAATAFFLTGSDFAAGFLAALGADFADPFAGAFVAIWLFAP
jgi:hypothetical protein